jgi:uncharacterized protein (TIGR03437 family)
MRKISGLLCLSLCIFPIWLAAQTPRDQARQADLNFVATQLPKLHVNFFFQLDPNTYNQAAQALIAQIPTLTDAEFAVRLARLVAMAGDEHTSIALDDAAAANAGFRQFPLQLRWLDDGVFVAAASAPYSRALGMQLVQVGSHPIQEVVQQLATVISHSNLHWVRYKAQSYLRGQQILQGLGLVPATATTQLTFQDFSGQHFTLDVSPASESLLEAPAPDQGPLPYFLQRTTEHYWFTYLAPLRLLYFKYNQCVNDPANPFAAFAARMLSVFDSNPVDTLVFDFRGNTGGDSSLIDAIMNGLLTRLPAIAANANFRVYVVIDKGTFSSGVDDAETFKLPASEYPPGLNFDPSKVVFVVGEPTGGAPGGYGNVLSFTLPSSRLDGIYSTKFFPTPDYITPNLDAGGPSFAPDIAIPFRGSDFFARHDPVFAAIAARSTGIPSQPSGSAIVVNGASFRSEHGLAAGSFASAFGSFATPIDSVIVNGQKGQVVAGTKTQVNFVIPASVTPGDATFSLKTGEDEVAQGHAAITAAGPGIFVLQPTDPSQPGAVLNQNSTVNTSSAPANRGDVLQIFATGYGVLDSSRQAAAQVLVAGMPAEVLFSGPIAQFPGLWQINARLPSTLSGQLGLAITANNIASNGVTVWVQ